MKKLRIKREGRFERDYTIEKERVWVGRAADCDIRDDDPSMSAKHAKIITILDNSFVQDMDSTNGVYVNGELVENQELSNGDVIKIAGLELLFQDEDEEADTGETLEEETDLEKTIVVSPDSPTLNEGSESQTRAIEEAEDEARRSIIGEEKNTKRCFVKVLGGPAAGKTLEMKKPLVTLGTPGSQVAVISKRRQGYFFTYVEGGGESDSQPLINNEPSGTEARKLNNHDVIDLAGNRIEVIIGDDLDA